MTNGFQEVGVRAVLAGAAQYVRDAAQVNASTAAVTAGVQRAGAQTHTTAATMVSDFTGVSEATGSLATSLDQLAGPFDGLIEKGREAGRSMVEAAQAAGEGGASGLSAALVGVVAAGAAAVATFVALGTAGAQWATQIQQITSVTGLSQQQAELYKNALELVGGDEQALIRTSFLLERMLTGVAEAEKAGAHPTNELTRAMASLGVEWRDTNGNVRDMGKLLPEVIDRLGTMEDRTQAVALSQQIFGRYGIEVTRVVENYANVMPKANELTAEFSTDQVNAGKAALEFQGNLTRLGQAYQFLGVRALPAFLAISGKVVDVITDWVHTNGEAFVTNLSNAMLAATHAIALFAQGFNAALAPAISAAGAALKFFGDALSAIPTPIIEWIIRLAGYATAIVVLATAFGLLSSAAVALTGALVGLGAALLLTPAGWIALAAALGIAAIGFVVVRGEMEKNAQVQRIQAEGTRLANEQSLEENKALYDKALAYRQAIAGQLAMAIATHATSGYISSLRTRLDEAEAALSAAGIAVDKDTKSMEELEAAAKKMTGAGGTVKSVLEDMGFAAGTTAEDIKKMTSEMITATILAENLKKFGGTATPFEIVNSAAFKEQLKVVLDAYKSARVQAEAADQANTALVNAAGYLTSAQKAAAEAAERAGEAAARAAERAAEEYARYVQKIVADSVTAAKRIRDAQVAQLDQLGDLVISALRAQYAEQERLTLESYSRQREAITQIYDERVTRAQDAAEAEKAAIDASTAALISGINAQIAAIRGAQSTEDRAAIVRKIALSYDPTERANAERDLRDFDRNTQVNALEAQAQTVQEQARVRKQAVEDGLALELDAIAQQREQTKKAFDFAEKAAHDTYAKQTDEFTIQSEARRLVMDQEQTKYVQDMIEKYAPQWQTAGISFGAQLLSGIRQQIEPYLRSLQNLVPGSGGGGASQAQVDAASYLSAVQQQGQTAAAGGAPASVLDQMRQTVVETGNVPSFDRGLDWGRVPQPMLATLHTGEVVLTPDQQAQFMGGPRFERGAFEGMFNGANFAGNPEDNARAFRLEFERMMDGQLGRGAHLNGI